MTDLRDPDAVARAVERHSPVVDTGGGTRLFRAYCGATEGFLTVTQMPGEEGLIVQFEFPRVESYLDPPATWRTDAPEILEAFTEALDSDDTPVAGRTPVHRVNASPSHMVELLVTGVLSGATAYVGEEAAKAVVAKVKKVLQSMRRPDDGAPYDWEMEGSD